MFFFSFFLLMMYCIFLLRFILIYLLSVHNTNQKKEVKEGVQCHSE